MKRKAGNLILFIFVVICLGVIVASCEVATAAPVGNSLEISTPRGSAVTRSRSVAMTLDLEETGGTVGRFKAAASMEFIFDKDYKTSKEISNLEMDNGNWYMAKVSYAAHPKIEPYVEFGMAKQNFKWNYAGIAMESDSDAAFAWGLGSKFELWDFKEQDMKVYFDLQYRTTDSEVEEVKMGGSSVVVNNVTSEVSEWQRALIITKELDHAMMNSDYRLVPYAGLTWSTSEVDLSFDYNNFTYDLYTPDNKNKIGFIAGCDIMPANSSSYAVNVEARLVDELSLTAGGVVRF